MIEMITAASLIWDDSMQHNDITLFLKKYTISEEFFKYQRAGHIITSSYTRVWLET